jgi:hypothetical protein
MTIPSLPARQFAPATERNRQPILDVLTQYLPKEGNILEIASGTGEHALFFAPHFAPRLWIPSDPDPFLRSSIEAWRQDCVSDNLQSPLNIDASMDVESLIASIPADFFPVMAVVNINMIHISPWSACEGLMVATGKILTTGGILYLYGPFVQDDQPTAPSNLAFDASLRDRNREWGLRSLNQVVNIAEQQGLSLQKIMEMPANNLSVLWTRS